MDEKCQCQNKKVDYVCVNTPNGLDCRKVDEAPKCFDRKVTFFKVD